MYLYSAKTNAFYPLELKNYYDSAETLPGDVIEVSDDVFYEYSEVPEGKFRQAGPDGMPVWKDIPLPTKEDLIKVAEQERQRLLANADALMLDWRTELMLGEISDANRDKLSAWLAYKNDMKTVDVTTDPEHVSWPVPPEA
ncbi:tail fiber assembly protein [Citrobacter sedlakii]|uniref:tail fiber assembly protein n=1 Tax=Citrobacter sedlakii TaxID=67826 RepID=UPI003339E3F9